MPTPDQWTYADLLDAMQKWPVNAGTAYVAKIPRFIRMAEEQLIKDLALEIFDVVDNTETLSTATRFIAKPTGLLQLRSMRLATIVSTTSVGATANGVCLTQDTAVNTTPLTINGSLAVSGSVTLNPPRQVSVTAVGAPSGVTIAITGTDASGNPQYEEIVTTATSTVLGVFRWATITLVESFNGGATKSVEVGTTATVANTLGPSSPVNRRSKGYCDAYNSDPAVVGRPKYFNEFSETQWEVVLAADQNYGVLLHFVKRPASIVDTNTSWLGDNVGDALFYGGLMKAERFLKADDRWNDIATDYTGAVQAAKLELRESIRVGDYSPVKPAASKAQ